VLVHSFNCIEYPVVALALNSLGAVCSTVSPLFSPTELAQQARLAQAKYIITNRTVEHIAIEAADAVGIPRDRIYAMGSSPEPKRVKCISEASKREFESFAFDPVDPSQRAMLPFSSGTTGLPKGVALSARNMVANTMQINHVEKLGPTMLGVLSFFHIYPMMLIHLALYQGSTNVVLPRFEPESFLKATSKHKIAKVHIAPPIALFLAHDPLVDKYDLSGTKFLISAGAPLGKEVETLVHKRIGVKVKQLYGMTEFSTSVNYGEDDNRKPGSVGRIVPNTELRVKCTETDKDLPHNERGELLYRGPQVMMGYYNNPTATESAIMPDGFLRTGDIGYIDDDGFVHIVDRLKELIKYKGHQVAPAELEDLINHHPDVADCCAVRGFDSQRQEIPKAYVVLKDKTNAKGVTPEDIMAFVAERVAPYKKVREVEFIDAIPKSLTGKILRRQLQERENKRLEESA
jgi:4-coumarate--CoA ligase